jgi:hypothetical protein
VGIGQQVKPNIGSEAQKSHAPGDRFERREIRKRGRITH